MFIRKFLQQFHVGRRVNFDIANTQDSDTLVSAASIAIKADSTTTQDSHSTSGASSAIIYVEASITQPDNTITFAATLPVIADSINAQVSDTLTSYTRSGNGIIDATLNQAGNTLAATALVQSVTNTTITVSGNDYPYASTYNTIQDTKIYESAARVDTNYEADVTPAGFELGLWAAGKRENGLIKVNALSNIPANANIVSARLLIWPDYASNSGIWDLYKVKRNFIATEATWNSFATGQAWQTAGCEGFDDREQVPSATMIWLTSQNNVEWIEFNSAQLAADVQAIVNGAVNTGWMIRLSNDSATGTYANFPQTDRVSSFDHNLIFEVTYNDSSQLAQDRVINFTKTQANNTLVSDVHNASIYVPPVETMLLGANSNWNWYWDTPNYFANVMRKAGDWERNSGTGAYTDNHGILTPSVGTDTFRATVSSEGAGMTAGTHTVRWTGSGSVQVTNSSTVPSTWDVTGAFTYAYTAGTPMYAHYKGTGLITLEIIKPAMVTSYDAGNQWDLDYLAWFATLGVKAMRGMDWNNTSKNFEEVWADRNTPASIIYREIPYELQIDFANRMGIDLWLNVPVRAAQNQNYCEQVGAIIEANIASNHRVYIEMGNEIWNTGDPWGDATEWVHYRNHTRYVATGSGTDVINHVGHSLATGDKVNFFRKKNAPEPASWTLRTGVEATVTVIDANSFRAAATYAGGGFSPTQADETYLYIRQSELTGQSDVNINYVAMYEQMLAWMTTTLVTRSKYYTMISSFQNSTFFTTARREAITTPANIDFMTVAPYSNGNQWGASINVTSGNVNPQASYTRDESTVHWGIYLATATPSHEEVIIGAGSVAYGSIVAAQYSYLSGFTGAANVPVVNGTAYKAIFIAVMIDTVPPVEYQSAITISFTPSVTPFTTSQAMSSVDKGYLDDMSMTGDFDIEQHVINAGGIPLIAYEGGTHEDRDRPQVVWQGLYDYYKSASGLEYIKRYLRQWAIKGIKRFFWYKDNSKNVGFYGLTSNWALSIDIADTADNRYNAYRSFSGEVPKFNTRASFSASTHNVTSANAAVLPYTIRSIVDASGSNTLDSGVLTYSIISGNSKNRFAISGNGVLQLTYASGVNWGVPNTFKLTVCAKNESTSWYATITVILLG